MAIDVAVDSTIARSRAIAMPCCSRTSSGDLLAPEREGEAIARARRASRRSPSQHSAAAIEAAHAARRKAGINNSCDPKAMVDEF